MFYPNVNDYMQHKVTSLYVFYFQLVVEVPFAAETPWPPPLDEGVSEETFDELIAPPPPSEETVSEIFGEKFHHESKHSSLP